MSDVESICIGILAAVHHGLSIDQAWTQRDDDAFDWWPGGGVRQRLRVEGPRDGDGDRGGAGDGDGDGAWWLAVETPVWHVPDPADLSRLRGAIDGLAVNAHGAAVRVDRAAGRVSLVSRVRLAAASLESEARRASGLAPVQARLALKAWSVAEEAVGPSAFVWRDDAPHPVHGRRDDLDEILFLPERLILRRALSLPGEGAGHLQATADALVALGVGHPVRRDDDHLWLALDVGSRGALLMVSIMHHPLSGPSVAATIVLDLHLDPDAARLEGDALLEAELAPDSRTWTLGSWVVRGRFDGEVGETLVHTSFLPVGLFSEGSGRALARALGAKVEGLRARYGGSGPSAGIEAPWLRGSTREGGRARTVS